MHAWLCWSEEAKRSRVNRKDCKGREVKKLLTKMQPMAHLINNSILIVKAPQVIRKNSISRKVIPLQSKSENGSDKVPTVGATVKAKYDGEWFTGKLVAYNKEINQWTIYVL